METKEDDIGKIKKKLRRYSKEDIIFYEPHFTERLILREGNKQEVIKNLLNPDNLVYSLQEKGKHGDTVHCLYFKMRSSRTMKLPVIFNRKLFILTYIMSYRGWQSLVKKQWGMNKHDKKSPL